MDKDEGNKNFEKWLLDNQHKIPRLLEVFSRTTIKDLRSGRRTIKSVPDGKKLKLYEITGLDDFKIELETHPSEMNLDSIFSGEQPTSIIKLRVEYDGNNLVDLAKECGVNRSTLYDYLSGKSINLTNKRDIESGLREFYSSKCSFNQEESQDGRIEPQTMSRQGIEEAPTSDISSIVDCLALLSSGVNALKFAVATESPSHLTAEIIHQTQTSSYKERQRAVNLAIDVLADQMEYFRSAPIDEREALAKSLDVNAWGYACGILSRIDRPSSSETVLRKYGRPGKK